MRPILEVCVCSCSKTRTNLRKDTVLLVIDYKLLSHLSVRERIVGLALRFMVNSVHYLQVYSSYKVQLVDALVLSKCSQYYLTGKEFKVSALNLSPCLYSSQGAEHLTVCKPNGSKPNLSNLMTGAATKL